MKRILAQSALPVLLLAAVPAEAALPLLTSTPAPGGGQSYSLALQTLVLLTALSFLPALLLLMTAFTRIIIVLSLLRQALGTMSTPPNQVLIGLALFLTYFVMAPVIDTIHSRAWQPYAAGALPLPAALHEGAKPLKQFMLQQTRQTDLALFTRIAGSQDLHDPEEIPLRILVPAFVTSELKTAFQIGFLIFLPFILIDLIVASTLMSMGMMMLSPMMISLPLKLMLFVLVDGWNLTLGSLLQSFSG